MLQFWGFDSCSYEIYNLLCYCATCYTLVSCSTDFKPWRWRCYFPPNRQLMYGLSGAIAQKMVAFIFELIDTWRRFIIINWKFTIYKVKLPDTFNNWVLRWASLFWPVAEWWLCLVWGGGISVRREVVH